MPMMLFSSDNLCTNCGTYIYKVFNYLSLLNTIKVSYIVYTQIYVTTAALHDNMSTTQTALMLWKEYDWV